MNEKVVKVLNFVIENPNSSSTEISEKLDFEISLATVKRILNKLYHQKLIEKIGVGKATKYAQSKNYDLFYPINLDTYYKLEIDERKVKENFNLKLIANVLTETSLFFEEELEALNALQKQFEKNIEGLTKNEYKQETENLAIDLSWKSAQIEGNTYSLLETERLLKEKQTADGKKLEEAIMLINHKTAIDFMVENSDFIAPLRISGIENIHSLLIKDLSIERNIRSRKVTITGTNYKPLDNQYQITEALQQMCVLINAKSNIFEKSFLSLILLSYIQAFMDGNKRTARIVCNAILINNNYCPISFRSVNSLNYKKAILLFYEQNNVTAFKKIFMEQFKFAVENYF